MKMPKLCFNLGTVSLAVVMLATPTRSYADTYQIFNLHSDQSYFFAGMDDSGHVVVNSPVCGIGASTCYFTFLNGVSTGSTSIAPIITADNGTPCTPAVPAGGSVQFGVCNNGRYAFTGFVSSTQYPTNVFTGPTLQDIFAGGEGFVFLNSLGDIVFDDHLSQNWYEAVDLTTLAAPEPDSLLLLATGMLALAAIIRRRPILHQ